MIAWFNFKRRLSLDYKNVCKVVEVINLFYLALMRGLMMTEQKSYFPFLYFNSLWQKSMELCKQSQEKLLQLMVVSRVNETWKHGIICSRDLRWRSILISTHFIFVSIYLISVIPEKIVWLLPGVPDNTGEIESAACLHMNLPASHYLRSRHWNWEE